MGLSPLKLFIKWCHENVKLCIEVTCSKYLFWEFYFFIIYIGDGFVDWSSELWN